MILQAIIEEKLPDSNEELCKIADLQGIDLRADNYRLLLVTDMGGMQSFENYQKNCIDLPQRCTRFFLKKEIRAVIEADYSGTCIILVMDVPQRKKVGLISRELIAYLEQHQMTGITVSVGGSVEMLSRLPYSYRMASNALSYRSLYSGERCLFAEDMHAMMNIATLQSTVKPDYMLQAFREGNLEKLRMLVSIHAEKVRMLSGESIEGRHPTSIRRMFVELTVYVLHIASDMGVDVDSILNGLDPYNFLLANDKSTPMIIDWFINMCSDLRNAIDEKTKNKGANIIRQVCDYIDMHITQYDLNLDDAAAAVNMTASYLSKLFHKEMGIGFAKFVVQCRLKIAIKLLDETELTVKEISDRSGFTSASYFGTVFKREIGIPPLAYRIRKAEAITTEEMSKNL